LAESAVLSVASKPTVSTEVVTALSRTLGEHPGALAWRLRALACYDALTLPNRTEQRWRYTDPLVLLPSAEALLRKLTSAASGSGNETAQQAAAEWKRLRDDEPAVLLMPGDGPRLNAAAEAAGVAIAPLWQTDADDELIGRAVPAAAGLFAALNGAAWNAGMTVRIPAGVELDQPLRIVLPAAAVSLPRLLIEVGPQAIATVIEEHCGGAAESRVVSVTELLIRPGARLHHVLVQRWQDGVHGHMTVRGRIERDAHFSSATAAFGGRVSKLDLGGILAGAGAHSELRGVVLGDRRQHFDHHTLHHHLSGNTRSDIDFKVAMAGRSRSTYTGLIRIEPDAPQSEAYQENRNLLLSAGSRADSIPELEILTDEVSCSHGATVAPIDPEQLFYLGSRGLGTDEAIQLIVRGFIASVMDRLPETVQTTVAELVSARLVRVTGGI